MSSHAASPAAGEARKTRSPVSPSEAPAALSVVIPALNEEAAISRQLVEIHEVLSRWGAPYEIIVVDDGSSDRTAERARECGVRLVQQPQNRGYGAALKAGISCARHDWILITDADGTYPAAAIPRLLGQLPGYDMVVGARVGADVHVPLVRRPAKWLLRMLATYLAEHKIPDLNSGLRVFRKELVEEFAHLLPAGFSFTTTMTLALVCNDYLVGYEPIDYYRREGESKIVPTDTFRFLVQILRTVMLFNPLRVFLPLGALPVIAGLGKLIYDLFEWNISDTSVLGILTGIILWAVGLLADQNVRLQMHRRKG